LLAAILLPGAARGGDVDRLAPIDVLYYRSVKPTEAETRWQQIPWMQDLAAAVKVAKKEKRPLFLWSSGDQPLDRC
jgi:hypothetical protein